MHFSLRHFDKHKHSNGSHERLGLAEVRSEFNAEAPSIFFQVTKGGHPGDHPEDRIGMPATVEMRVVNLTA